jgi:hypothetical protein
LKALEPLRPSRRVVESEASGIAARIGVEAPEEPLLEPIPSLPRDHPAWCYDLAELSDQARLLLADLAAVAFEVLGFWDHAIRSLRFGEQRFLIDASGSYRLE